MPTNIRIIHAREFVRATATGELDLEATKKVLIDIAAAAPHPGDYEILVDLRKAHSRLSHTDEWYLAAELSKHRRTFSRKTAVLCPVERLDNAEFFALCAANAGFRVKAFTSFEDAIDWLTEPQPSA